ncbi:hypothetical protein RND81_02G250000 [Saponaria officinalis]|uniref:Uncharacterized protein n=1 Tax=Saponaria officinalis TaxID=3572 RepID=A0AAW1MY04_SAPOF
MVPSEKQLSAGEKPKKVMNNKCGSDELEEVITRWSNTSSTHDESSTTSSYTATTTTTTTTASWLQLGLPIPTAHPHNQGLMLDLNLAVAAAVAVAAPLNFMTTPTPPPPTSSFEFKLLSPPPSSSRRPQLASLWFTLLPCLHQSIQPSTPRLSKSFIRIKDQRLRVRLVMKYVANKLGLDCESRVEIRCRGQVVEPHLTMQQVRDHIWSPKQQGLTLLPNSSSSASHHLMLLHYTTYLP